MLVDKTNLMICLRIDLKPDEWIKDSGCSKHMTGNRKLFSSYKAYNGGNVIFGSNLHGNIIGKGQICDNKCIVTFSEHDSEITKDGKIIGRAHASHKAKNMVLTTRCLEVLHMDLFCPSVVWSYRGNLYTLVIVDDYSSTGSDASFTLKISQLSLQSFDLALHVFVSFIIQRISLTGFPAQSAGSSNTDVLDSPCLLDLITGTSQSRQHGKSESDSYYLSD
ncbi:hypothetical protein Tco_0937224 [Tanacetum coccineum]|uniref:Retrovirus-related Pol polyprotein from transposon TNT 1-94-like beta-barrel domain-containing protein n=1 Tax=Tanacetum coccineum TaxID=301880 RepID=A0ABQ5DKN8_9ASTR